MGGGPEEQFDTYGRLKRLYSIRSQVVHGAQRELSGLEEAAKDTVEYLRRSVLRWLEVGGVTPAELDRQLLG